jgi:hypothetical protein
VEAANYLFCFQMLFYIFTSVKALSVNNCMVMSLGQWLCQAGQIFAAHHCHNFRPYLILFGSSMGIHTLAECGEQGLKYMSFDYRFITRYDEVRVKPPPGRPIMLALK